MAGRKSSPKQSVIPCKLLPEVRQAIENYAADLKRDAWKIGSHGLTKTEFKNSGLLHGAVEKLRGSQAATMALKRDFIAAILDFMKSKKRIESWEFTGAGERHDYQVEMPNGRLVVFEAKGCMDGNNTNIWQRPPNADEFFIWSMCQNPGADPGHNAWSGIHTRLGAKIIAEKEKVDGLVIWDRICGTPGRPCPKLKAQPKRKTKLLNDRIVPPPCIYLFPRTVPDPRNNPKPKVWRLEEITFLKALWECFNGNKNDIIEIHLHAKMEDVSVVRQTTLQRDGVVLTESKWTKIKRASR
jgi:hypothetical protein